MSLCQQQKSGFISFFERIGVEVGTVVRYIYIYIYVGIFVGNLSKSKFKKKYQNVLFHHIVLYGFVRAQKCHSTLEN